MGVADGGLLGEGLLATRLGGSPPAGVLVGWRGGLAGWVANSTAATGRVGGAGAGAARADRGPRGRRLGNRCADPPADQDCEG